MKNHPTQPRITHRHHCHLQSLSPYNWNLIGAAMAPVEKMPHFFGWLGKLGNEQSTQKQRLFIQEKCSDIDNSLSENKIPVGILFSGVSCFFPN